MKNITNLMDSIIDYKNGKIQIEELVKNLYAVSSTISGEIMGGGLDAYSFRQSAFEEIQYVEEAANDECKLRLDALLCDIANNFAHSLMEKNKVRCTESSKKLEHEMKGVKKGMAIKIIQECQRIGHKAYGIKEGAFFVDVPMCGQIGWHFPTYCGLKAKYYEFPIEEKSVEYPNKKLLCEGLKVSELSRFSERMKKVIECQDVEELNEALYDTPDMRRILSSKINPPSEQDLLFDEKRKSHIREKGYLDKQV